VWAIAGNDAARDPFTQTRHHWVCVECHEMTARGGKPGRFSASVHQHCIHPLTYGIGSRTDAEKDDKQNGDIFREYAGLEGLTSLNAIPDSNDLPITDSEDEKKSE